MAEDILIQQLREIKYPGTIDITNKVMAEVSKRPLLVPAKRFNIVRFATAAAACILLAVAINFTLIFTRNYDTHQIGNALAEVYDFHADYGSVDDEYEEAYDLASFYR